MNSDVSRAGKRVRSPTSIMLGLFAIAPLVTSLSNTNYLIPTGTHILVYALAASSLNFLVGYAGIFSLGHAAFIAVGAYGVAIFAQFVGQSGITDLWNQALVTWPLALAIAGILSFGMALISMKREGLTLAMITLALGQMIYLLLVALKVYGGDDGLNFYPRNSIGPFQVDSDLPFYYVCFASLLLYLLLQHFLMRSRLGRIVEAVAMNPVRSSALGVNVYWVRVFCFVFASLGAALSGVLLANANEFVSPGMGNWSVTGELLVMIVLGGIATRVGPLIGACFYIAMLYVVSDQFEQTGLVMGIVIVAGVLYLRRGVAGMFTGKRGTWAIRS